MADITVTVTNDKIILLEGGGVSAASTITDHAVVRGNGGVRGVQDSTVIIDDLGNISGVKNLVATGNLLPGGSVDGRDVAVDGAKLDTIETSADVTDAINVAAATAVMDADFAAAEGFMRKTGAGAYEGVKSNLTAVVAPGVTDDAAAGYAVGSVWVDTVLDQSHTCVDSTNGAAVWFSGGGGAIGFADLDTDLGDANQILNAIALDSPAVTVTSDGATITLTLEKSGTGDIRFVFSSGVHTHDCTPADTVTLTAGTDASPVERYVYVLESTLTLTEGAAWPAAEHAPIATVVCQSAASLQTDGAYKVHAWTDHAVDSTDMGHLAHINEWIRTQHATYRSGVAQTLTITPASPDTVIFTTASGVVMQLHDHTFPAFSGTPDLYVVNDSATAYDVVTDLADLLTDSTGASMSNKRFALVIWGVVSEATGDCKLMVNLPSGSYNSDAAVIADDSKYSNYTIPAEFVGCGFLISELKLQHQSAGGGDWTSVQEVDLRGQVPSHSAGGGAAALSEFADNAFRIQDDGDASKEIAFQASGITTATTRTITMPDADVDLGNVPPAITEGQIWAGDSADDPAAASAGEASIYDILHHQGGAESGEWVQAVQRRNSTLFAEHGVDVQYTGSKIARSYANREWLLMYSSAAAGEFSLEDVNEPNEKMGGTTIVQFGLMVGDSGGAITGMCVWCGLSASVSTGADAGVANWAPNSIGVFVGFDADAHTNWQLVTKTAVGKDPTDATTTVVDTGVAVLSTVPYSIVLDMRDGDNIVYAAVNGTVVSSSTDLPTSGDANAGWGMWGYNENPALGTRGIMGGVMRRQRKHGTKGF